MGVHLPVLLHLGAPVFGIDLMGHGARQLDREDEPFRRPGRQPLDSPRPGHLVPGIVQLNRRKTPGVGLEHRFVGSAGCVKALQDPFGIGIAAGADINLFNRRKEACLICPLCSALFMSPDRRSIFDPSGVNMISFIRF